MVEFGGKELCLRLVLALAFGQVPPSICLIRGRYLMLGHLQLMVDGYPPITPPNVIALAHLDAMR